MTATASGTNTAALVARLAELATRFGGAAAVEKRRVLARLAEREIRAPRQLTTFHEALCFLRAYPDAAAVLAAVEDALAAIASRVGRWPPRRRARLRDSGMAGTDLEYPFGLPMSRWLVERFPRDVDVRWRGYRDGERLEDALAMLVAAPEAEAFTEGGPGWRAWLAAERGSGQASDLALLVRLFDRSALPADARDQLFESLGLPVVVRLRAMGPSRSRAGIPWPRPTFQREALVRGQPDFVTEVTRPLLAPRRAAPAEAAALVELARAAMATRARELYAFSYPNVHDVLVADVGGGLRIVLLGLPPDRRLPLDVYYAFLVLKNGIPVGYGAGWALFDTLEFAFNLFEPFRRGESATLMSTILRVYRRVLGMRAVIIDRYQIGHENPEAVAAGAFYFYARLGFQPVDAQVRKLAEAEQEKIGRDRTYRSSAAVLRRLARSSLVLRLDPDADPDLRVTGAAVAALVTRRIARDFGGDRPAAVRATRARVAAILEARGLAAWPASERRAFERQALIAALVPDLARWPGADRRRLVALMRAHGAPDLQRYARLLTGHRRWRASLERLAGTPSP